KNPHPSRGSRPLCVARRKTKGSPRRWARFPPRPSPAMDWITEHSDLINVMSNVGMLVVWITYLQVFLAGYRRQKKATILINRGGGGGLEAHCLVTNMSAEAIYVHTLIARLKGPSGTI